MCSDSDVITRYSNPLNRFWAYAVEREAVRIRRARGDAGPWTGDAVLQRHRFCNIYREDDRVTLWFRRHVRDRYAGTPAVVPATVLFRWFNRPTTGEALFNQLDIEGGTPFERWLKGAPASSLEHAVRSAHPNGPWVTGAYLINTKSSGGADKLDGVCRLFAQWWALRDWGAEWQAACGGRHTLQSFWALLKEAPNLKGFMSYEVVTDLRHTLMFDNVSDAMTWAHAGPGAVRGLNRLAGRPLLHPLKQCQALHEMRQLLNASKLLWPRDIEGGATRTWELREVEHLCCEVDKWERTASGEGRPKEVFRG